MQASKPTDQEIVLTRTLAASRERVFDALTRAEHLTHWLSSPGFTLAACITEGRVGGSLRYVFQRANGRRIEVRGFYDAFEPPSKYSYEESYDFSPLKVHVTTELEQVGNDTLFRQTLRYRSKQERDEDYDGVVTSSAAAHANLARYLERGGR